MFVMYCVKRESGSSLLIESVDSMTSACGNVCTCAVHTGYRQPASYCEPALKAGSQYDAGPCVTYGTVAAAYGRLRKGVHKIACGDGKRHAVR